MWGIVFGGDSPDGRTLRGTARQARRARRRAARTGRRRAFSGRRPTLSADRDHRRRGSGLRPDGCRDQPPPRGRLPGRVESAFGTDRLLHGRRDRGAALHRRRARGAASAPVRGQRAERPLALDLMARREGLQARDGVGVEVVGPHSSSATRQLVEFARRNRLPFAWLDAAASSMRRGSPRSPAWRTTRFRSYAYREGLASECLPPARCPGHSGSGSSSTKWRPSTCSSSGAAHTRQPQRPGARASGRDRSRRPRTASQRPERLAPGDTRRQGRGRSLPLLIKPLPTKPERRHRSRKSRL